MPNNVNYYTVEEIASELRVTTRTVQNWIKQKKLPAYQFGRDYRIPAEEFKKFLEDSKTIK